ncbi:energy transducer TonB [Stenotrophomonas sp. SY1]|uniref:energy transducer TonB n=1 Tax=Stenotrophomonas sp. SY1 TaxID=477235 RepID=UPI001E2F73F1|nr:energy transducer TonB [Stenotrophomonas sp. SY1]MCD9085626.1 energy transducer TonB [Stenotrophomonas sp. SY1]
MHIEADGSVSGLVFHQEEELPESVVTLVRGAALQWRFEPVTASGSAVRVVAPMSLRVVARKVDGSNYEIGLRGVSFQKYDSTDPQDVASIDMKPPRYPEQAYRSGATGNVHLLVKVGRDGKVEDAFSEQVNLTFLSREADQRHFREVLASNAVAAAKRWTFPVPTEGDAAAQPYWNVRVPVRYSTGDERGSGRGEAYGRWSSYVAGPRGGAPWRDASQEAGPAPDTLAAGSVYMADNNKGPRLLTPLQGS